MKGIKTLDFFQKISLDNVSQPTIVGSLLSLFAMGLMVFLLMRELIDFYSPHIKTDSIVFQDPNPTEKIKFNLAMKLYHLPCHLASLDQEDSLRNHRLDISDTIKKSVLTKAGKYSIFDQKMSLKSDSLYKSIEDVDGCNLAGHIPITKVPGNVHLSFHKYRAQWSLLKAQKPELADQVNLSHQFVSLHYGTNKNVNLKKFGFDPRSFYRTADLPNLQNTNPRKNYDYFLKIIPYQFIDENRGTHEDAYQYSISFKESDFDPREEEMPIILMRYQFSPISMRVTLEKRDYLNFLTHICAIIGGVFVVFSLFNRFLVSLCDCSSSSVSPK